MTIYELANKYMKDDEHNSGGIPRNERKWMDEVGFEYTVEGGCIKCYGEDASKFVDAMCTLAELNKKYSK